MNKYTHFAFAILVAILASVTQAEPEFFTPKKDLDGLKQNTEIQVDLPNVLLLGDSISIGYTPVVIDLLKDVANTQRPNANCGSTAAGIKKIDSWLGDSNWDIIHFNWGLHDLCYRHPDSKETGHRDKINGKVTVSLEKYETNLDALVVRLKETGAKLLWVNTTPVPPGEVGRFPGDELKYNAVAAKIMEKHGIPINDLHNVAASFSPELWQGPGNVHFSKEGSAQLGEKVATFIKDFLPKEQ
ncbi:SGNH/GDSL hydrolase family protein [Puniceicoccaceae bacterium K14]|nr:SGNH/GDSL hydrolase family protein [Puniceicoccaceae bacterium K14]